MGLAFRLKTLRGDIFCKWKFVNNMEQLFLGDNFFFCLLFFPCLSGSKLNGDFHIGGYRA
jgi:hypothetical protein